MIGPEGTEKFDDFGRVIETRDVVRDELPLLAAFDSLTLFTGPRDSLQRFVPSVILELYSERQQPRIKVLQHFQDIIKTCDLHSSVPPFANDSTLCNRKRPTHYGLENPSRAGP